MITQELTDRFWQNVHKTDGCWHWLMQVHSGYGHYTFTQAGKTRNIGAHRFAWNVSDRPQLEHRQVLVNTCGTAGCVRPEHHERLEHGYQGNRPLRARKKKA